MTARHAAPRRRPLPTVNRRRTAVGVAVVAGYIAAAIVTGGDDHPSTEPTRGSVVDYPAGADVAPWDIDTVTDGTTTCDPFTADAFDAGVKAGTMYPTVWAELMAAGWRGITADGIDAIYAPGCHA